MISEKIELYRDALIETIDEAVDDCHNTVVQAGSSLDVLDAFFELRVAIEEEIKDSFADVYNAINEDEQE